MQRLFQLLPPLLAAALIGYLVGLRQAQTVPPPNLVCPPCAPSAQAPLPQQRPARQAPQPMAPQAPNAPDPRHEAARALMGHIEAAMTSAKVEHQVLAMDCEQDPCIYFGEFEHEGATMEHTWQGFLQAMNDNDAQVITRQWKLSDGRALFAISPAAPGNDPDAVLNRAQPMLEQLRSERRNSP